MRLYGSWKALATRGLFSSVGRRLAAVARGDTDPVARSRKKKGLKDLVRIWVDLFDEHELLTSATAIALQGLVAAVALALLAVAVLGETGHESVWNDRIAPQIVPKVLPEVFGGIDATV